MKSWTDLTDPQGYFDTTYNVPYNGSIGIYNLSVYLTDNPYDQEYEYFNVTPRVVNIDSNKLYYERGDLLNISG